MNVCFATYQSVSLLNGGPRTQVLQTKRCLEELGVRVSLFETWRDIRTEPIDLLHLFGANIGTYHLAREVRKLGIPTVVTPIFYTRRPPFIMRSIVSADRLIRRIARGIWTDYALVRDICMWAKAVAPNTAREARLISRGLGIPPERITVVPNGVEERFSHADPEPFRRKYGITDFVLNVGHIGPDRKNVLRLIEALEQVNVPSVIIGRIEDNAYGRACLSAARRNPRLLVLEMMPNDSDLLASAYAACDVFALPSLFETPGIAALEAALAGAKIVITRHGGTHEYFGEEAEYVEPTSSELIHHGILTALNKPRNSALKERIQKEFLWERVAEKTRGLYEQVLESAPRSNRTPPIVGS